ncbi:MAG TPA: hypothetical protein VGI92_03020 [Gemmatimonadales bacterium]
MTIHPGRPSAPTLIAVGRRIAAARTELVNAWFDSILERQAGTLVIEPSELRRTLCLIVSLLGHMTGPLRRETRDAWYAATELFGRLAEARGLSAGEVVDEIHHLRQLLIIELGDIIVALPARQQLPAVLRVDRVCDAGVSNAVVGYTDALVAKMFARDGVPVPAADSLAEILASRLSLEEELRLLDERLPD